MGCVTSTAKRRRRQAVGGYKNIEPARRPRYSRHSEATYQRREAQRREKQIAMQGRKRRKG